MSFASAGQVTAVNVTAAKKVTKGQRFARSPVRTLSANVANASGAVAKARSTRISTDNRRPIRGPDHCRQQRLTGARIRRTRNGIAENHDGSVRRDDRW